MTSIVMGVMERRSSKSHYDKLSFKSLFGKSFLYFIRSRTSKLSRGLGRAIAVPLAMTAT